jgi:hypothetical protein
MSTVSTTAVTKDGDQSGQPPLELQQQGQQLPQPPPLPPKPSLMMPSYSLVAK